MAVLGSLIVLIWSISVTVSTEGQELAWSCDFKKDHCSIKQGNDDSGSWIRYRSGHSTYFYANFKTFQLATAIVKCTIPLKFSATSGTLSFEHYSSYSSIDVTVCHGGPVFITVGPTRKKWWSFTRRVQCRTKIDITFRARRGRHWYRALQPDLRIDNIKVYRDVASTTNFPSTSTKPTLRVTESVLPVTPSGSVWDEHTSTPSSSPNQTPDDELPPTSGSKSPASNNLKETVTSTSTSVPSSQTSLQYTNITVQRNAKQKGSAKATITSVVLLLAAVTSIFFIVYRRRRMAERNKHTGDVRKHTGRNVYANATFSVSGDDTDHPDVIREIRSRNEATSNFHMDGYNGFAGGEDPSVFGQRDDTYLKNPSGMMHQEHNRDQEYSVLKGPGASSTDAKEQVYDHLNRGYGDANVHQEQRHNKSYSAAEYLSDEDLYNTMVH